jgi:hypothetical protein
MQCEQLSSRGWSNYRKLGIGGMHQPSFWTVLAGFLSFVLFPFLGILSIFSKKLLQTLTISFFVIVFSSILVLGLAGSGVTPMGPGDVVTSEQRDYWMSRPWVNQFALIGVVGLLLFVPFLIAAWLYQDKNLSRPFKFLINLGQIGALLIATYQFGTTILLPWLHRLK